MEPLLCPISARAKSEPHGAALITDDHTWTYLTLDAVIALLSRALEQLGIREGTRVAFIAQNTPATVQLFFALWRLRAIGCPLSYRTPPEQIPEQLEKLGTSHLLDPQALVSRCSGERFQESSLNPHVPATLLFTSGSSGTPKIACHTYANHYFSAAGVAASLKVDATSRWLLSLPLFHVSGLGILMRCFLQGAAVVISQLALQEALQRHCISHLSVVPTQLCRLPVDLTTALHCVLLGGAPIAATLLEKYCHLPLYTTYGMTEMSSLITLSQQNPDGQGAGKVLPFRKMQIREGEIWVGGPTRFAGYWNSAEQVVEPAPEWFPTGDLGRIDENGNLHWQGRKDRLFISGGENIQPEEIELALCSIPGIERAAVLPRPDPEFGQRPVAFVADSTGAHTLSTVREALAAVLPSFKHPVQLFPLPAEMGLKIDLSGLRRALNQ